MNIEMTNIKTFNKMKKQILYIYTCIALIIGCSSCEDADYLKYDQNQKDGVFLNYTEDTDSLFYNFGFYEITENTIEVPVNLMGMPRDYDREFTVSLSNERYADESAIPAVEEYYEIPVKVTLKADSTIAKIPVKLLRHTDLEDVRAVITLNIESTNDLEIKGHSEYTITFDDKTPEEPNWWTTYDMGEFTKFKGQLFYRYFWEMEQSEKPIYDQIVDRWGQFLDIMPNYWGNSPLVVYRISFNKYVKLRMWEYSEAHPELELNIQKPTI